MLKIFNKQDNEQIITFSLLIIVVIVIVWIIIPYLWKSMNDYQTKVPVTTTFHKPYSGISDGTTVMDKTALNRATLEKAVLDQIAFEELDRQAYFDRQIVQSKSLQVQAPSFCSKK